MVYLCGLGFGFCVYSGFSWFCMLFLFLSIDVDFTCRCSCTCCCLHLRLVCSWAYLSLSFPSCFAGSSVELCCLSSCDPALVFSLVLLAFLCPAFWVAPSVYFRRCVERQPVAVAPVNVGVFSSYLSLYSCFILFFALLNTFLAQ